MRDVNGKILLQKATMQRFPVCFPLLLFETKKIHISSETDQYSFLISLKIFWRTTANMISPLL